MNHNPARLLAPIPALGGTSRVPPLGTAAAPRGRELVALLGAGAGAGALTAFGDLGMRIPGHHILFAMFPLALGFALVPRRTAGTVMGAAGVTTLAGLGALGVHLPGPGAIAGLALAGPLLDLALRWGHGGWRLYAAFIAAGMGTNVLAFVARGVTKYF